MESSPLELVAGRVYVFVNVIFLMVSFARAAFVISAISLTVL